MVQVNPYEVENVSDTLNRALEMPLDERQLRMFQLKKREKSMDVDAWVQGFLQTMGAIYVDRVNFVCSLIIFFHFLIVSMSINTQNSILERWKFGILIRT